MRKPKIKHVGLHANRLHKDAGNPREVAFAQQWVKEQHEGSILALLLDRQVSARDAEVAATVIQWLGSNIGMSFIDEAMRREPSIAEWLRHRLGHGKSG